MRSAAAWLSTLPFAAWAVVRTLGLVDGFRVTELLAFTPYVAAASLAPLILSLSLRRWAPAAVAAVTAIALLASVLPRALGGGSADVEDGTSLTVMTVNMNDGAAGARDIVGTIERYGVDVLSVQELSSEGRPKLARNGLPRILPRAFLGVDQTAMLSAAGEPVPAAKRRRIASVRFSLHGRDIEIWAPHPAPPIESGSIPAWRFTLETSPPATSDGTLRVIAGDLNATLDHPELRGLIGTGYVDAADAVGSGLTPTYPSDGLLPPPITIDHVLVDERIQVKDVWIEDIATTDHRAVIAELLIPPQ